MKNLPLNWRIKPLGEIVVFLDSKRKPIKESERLLRSGDIPYYGANGQVGWIDDYIFNEPLILLAEDGGHFGSKIKPIAYKIFGKSWVNNHAHVLKLKDGFNLEYLHKVLSFYDVSKYLTGTTRLKLCKGDAEKIPIPLPPLHIQKQIADILEAADRARQKREEADKLTEEFLQAAFIDMFGDPVTNPMWWEKRRLESLGFWRSGGTPPRDIKSNYSGTIPWYTSGELNSMYLIESKEYITADAIKCSNAKLIEPNSILIGMYDTAAFKLGITTQICTCNQAIAYAKLNNAATNTIYVYFALLVGREYFVSMQRGVRQKNLNLSMIKKTTIPIPSKKHQTKFAEIVQKTEALKAKQAQSKKELDELFYSLMQKAFNGELVI